MTVMIHFRLEKLQLKQPWK